MSLYDSTVRHVTSNYTMFFAKPAIPSPTPGIPHEKGGRARPSDCRPETLLGASVRRRGAEVSLQTPDPNGDRVYGLIRSDRPKGIWSLLGVDITLAIEAYEKEPYCEPPFDQDAWAYAG